MGNLRDRIAAREAARRAADDTATRPWRIVHRHDGGSVHNHAWYTVTDSRGPAELPHAHSFRPDWRPAR